MTMSTCFKMRLKLGDFEVVTTKRRMASEAARWQSLSDRTSSDGSGDAVIDGWEAARQLKSMPETSDIPIVGLSAHALAGARDKALAAGCDEFDTKPIEFERLVATIRRICEMKLARKAG